MTTIDVHAHCVPAEILERLRLDGPQLGIELGADSRVIIAGRPTAIPLRDDLVNRTRRLAAMDGSGVDIQVLSPWIDLTAYGLSPASGARWSRWFNEALAAEAASVPDRFLAIGTVPLQSPDAAVDELRVAVEELGLIGVEIGTRVGTTDLASAGLEAFWREAARLRCLVLLHPLDPLPGTDLSDRFLHNIVGRPAETTIAAARLLLAGVLERHPELVLCLVHGGGFLPYQIGRMQTGWEAKPEIVAADTVTPPAEALSRLYFDTVLHDPAAIGYLVDRVGADRVLLGTDYPFEMGDVHPVATLEAVPRLAEGDRAAVLSGNVERLFGHLR